MRPTTERGSLWELAVLALLREGPMHPYQMQRLLKERHEDEILGLKRGSLYHAIHRLTRAGLIEPVTVGREGRRPERTTYRLRPNGRREFVRWLRQRIATPQQEPSEFMGSISFLVHLSPKDATTELEARARALEAESHAIDAALKYAGARLARILLIEREYLLGMHKAELAWVQRLIADLHSGRLEWDLKKILQEARAAAPKPAARKER